MNEPELKDLLRLFERELQLSVGTKGSGFYSKRLKDALDYALSSPGKRLRPLLVMAMAQGNHSQGGSQTIVKAAMPAALAVEYVHTYSLVHDDLPAMDDDDYRRGRLSVHRRFDEGLAILVGDALLADAFYHASLSKVNALKIVRELALTSGSFGLVAGQAEDLNRDNLSGSAEKWLEINAAKTARLFEGCAVIGALAVDAEDVHLAHSREFGRHFGIAFQLKDDVDDNAHLAQTITKESLTAMLSEHLRLARLASERLPHPRLVQELLHLTFAI